MTSGYCSREELGEFIIDLPGQLSINSTSIWSHRVIFPNQLSPVSSKSESSVEGDGFWDNPAGNPTPTDSEYASPWRRSPSPVYDADGTDTWTDGDFHIMATGTADAAASTSTSSGTSGGATLYYHDPINYPVPKTGYYCVAMVPLTVMDMRRSDARAAMDVPTHPKYTGTILFRNTFNGQLPAAEYPKVNVCAQLKWLKSVSMTPCSSTWDSPLLTLSSVACGDICVIAIWPICYPYK